MSQRTLEAGSAVEQYRIDSVLGVGQCGITYLAKDERSGVSCAIKEFFPRANATRGNDRSIVALPDSKDDLTAGVQRFLRDIHALSGIRHRNIVGVLAGVEVNNTAYMVMAQEPGERLSELLKRGYAPTPPALVLIALSLLDAVQTMHRAGLIHRDIKENNILLRADGAPVLIDFGAARVGLLRRRLSLGNAVQGDADYGDLDGTAGPWTDIHALAALLFRLASAVGKAGRGPCPADVSEAIRMGIAAQPANVATLVDQWRSRLENLAGTYGVEWPAPDVEPAVLMVGEVVAPSETGPADAAGANGVVGDAPAMGGLHDATQVDATQVDATQVEATQVEATQVEATQVEATQVEATQVEATQVEATQVEATQVEATQVEATQVDATQVDATQVDATQVDATQVDATQVDATQVEATQVEATQVEATQVEATQVEATQVEATQVEATQVEATQVEATQVDATQVDATQVDATQVDATQVDATQVEATQVDATQVDATQVEATQVEATQVEATQVEATQVEATQVEATQVEATQVEATQVEATQVEATQVEATQVEATQVEATQVEATQVEATQVEATQVEATQVEATQVEATQVEATQVEATQVEATQVEATQVETAQVETAQVETAQRPADPHDESTLPAGSGPIVVELVPVVAHGPSADHDAYTQGAPAANDGSNAPTLPSARRLHPRDERSRRQRKKERIREKAARSALARFSDSAPMPVSARASGMTSEVAAAHPAIGKASPAELAPAIALPEASLNGDVTESPSVIQAETALPSPATVDFDVAPAAATDAQTTAPKGRSGRLLAAACFAVIVGVLTWLAWQRDSTGRGEAPSQAVTQPAPVVTPAAAQPLAGQPPDGRAATPTPAPVPAATTPPMDAVTAARVAELIGRAEGHMQSLQLTTPKGDNAFEDYNEVLTLQADNDQAKRGIAAISSRYVELADGAIARGQYVAARRYLELAEMVDPTNGSVQERRQQLRARREAGRAQRQSDVVADAGGGDPPVSDDGVVDRVRDFLEPAPAGAAPVSRADEIKRRLGGQ